MNISSIENSGISSYIRLVANHMALRDWQFVIENTPAAEGYDAQVLPVQGRKLAGVRLKPGFTSFPPETQRHSIVHELLHCHHAGLTQGITTMLETGLACGLMNCAEFAIDGIADAFAPLMPLPRCKAAQPDLRTFDSSARDVSFTPVTLQLT